jgi:ribosomal-protein-alanine N-acetyltransferase
VSTDDTTIIETERLILRLMTMDDLDTLAALYAKPEIRKYFPDGVQSYDETKREIEWNLNVYYAKYGYGLWSTILKATGAMIGRCGLIPWEFEDEKEVEVAYMIDQPYWGQGLGTEAAQGIVRYGFDDLQLPRLTCLIDPDHPESQNVAIKLGMTVEKDTVMDGMRTFIYGMANPAFDAASRDTSTE